MKQEHKNFLLIILLAILVAVSVVLSFVLRPTTTTFAQSDLFAIKDTAAIHKITITSPSKNIDNVLERSANSWMINANHHADPNIIRVLLSVLHQVNISRSVAKNQAQTIRDDMLEKGYQIAIENKNGKTTSFRCLGNSRKTRSIFMDEATETLYIVNLPGYDSYVAGIFEVSDLDWRNRLIFHSNWRSLQKLELLYPSTPSNNMEIRFNLDFFEMTGVESLDTVAMMEFIDQFQYFQADRFIVPLTGSSYDSLLTTEPYLILTINDIDPAKSNRVIFHDKLPGDPMILGRLDDQQIALFDFKRIRNTFRRKSDFAKDK